MNIGDLKPDPHNAREHTERGHALLIDILQRLGAGRSILINQDNQIVAGHGVVEACAAMGIEDITVVDGDGTALIAVRRTFTPEQAAEMSIADNRAAELSHWSPAQLSLTPVKLDAYFSDKELAKLKVTPVELPASPTPAMKTTTTCPSCGHVF